MILSYIQCCLLCQTQQLKKLRPFSYITTIYMSHQLKKLPPFSYITIGCFIILYPTSEKDFFQYKTHENYFKIHK